MATEGGRSWERVKGTPDRTHPNPILAAYIDRQTEKVNRLMEQKYPDDHPEFAGMKLYPTRRMARRAAQR